MTDNALINPQAFDSKIIKSDFPIFDTVKPYGKRLVYLDNAASAQKPACVLSAIDYAYTHYYANVHRGLHYLANKATEHFENARQTVKSFLKAKSASEIIWTSGATEGINLVSYALASTIKAGDEIILSVAEHHSNIVPWHFLREKHGAVIRWVNLLPDGSLDMVHYESLLNNRTKIVAITHMSNILGTINDIKTITTLAHKFGAYVLADGSQAAVHLPIDVVDLDVDFYVITGHKLYAPTGIGAVYIKDEIAQTLPPFKGGGEMINTVTMDTVTYNTPPHRFEAGTPQIMQAIGLAAGIDYMHKIGFENIIKHEKHLTDYMRQKFAQIPEVIVYGTSENKGALFTFNIQNIHPHDLATYLDRQGIAIRAGHHCGQVLMQYLNINATARASCAIYNTTDDIDDLCTAIGKAIAFFNQ
jgi:cysteine desulfurase / selenocysteine lyase